MQILYVASGDGPDYQCDMLFHGLRDRFGDGVVDASRLSYMYRDTFAANPASRKALYGKGFTLYGLLGSDAAVDRTDIEGRIRGHVFDLVVYGSICRCQDFLSLVLQHYDPRDIVFIDGEDFPDRIFWPVIGRGLYFKRELDGAPAGAIPIQFAIPAEKISDGAPKTRLMAHIDPRDRSTYIYDDEASYYGDYGSSMFAVTVKKAGWDCLRHYEIMANRCMPLFADLQACPSQTLARFPRYEIWQAQGLLEHFGASHFETPEGRDEWERLTDAVARFLRANLTTAALADYVIACWKGAGRPPLPKGA